MKAVLSRELPRGSRWLYEIKWDGIRALAVKENDRVSLYSRTEKDMTTEFPGIVEAIRRLPARQALLDGEIVALDEEGRPSFQLLQSRYNNPRAARLYFYVFDIVGLDTRDTSGLPLIERKKLVERLLNGAPDVLRFSGAIEADSDRVLSAMKKSGLEGLVAKLRDSRYETGQRSSAWVKVKWTNEQEFVIGGYTPPSGSRAHFGALLVGYFRDKQLIFAGKVGTGFSFESLRSLHRRFQALIIPECPFINLPVRRTGAYAGGLSAAEMRRCTWLKPQLVCQVRFAEWTREGFLRQPAFLGLREDKKATEVVREI
jgi:bifunctional non-homologous end joining protein LigD